MSITPIGRLISLLPADQSLPSDSLTLFYGLNEMLAGVVETKEACSAEVMQTKLPQINGTPTMYIPSCETVSTQISTRKENPTNNETPTKPTIVPYPASALPCQSNTPTSNSVRSFNDHTVKVQKYQKDIRYLESHCKHGILHLIHVHIKRETIDAAGRMTTTKET